MAKKDKITGAFDGIIGDKRLKTKKSGRVSPVGVALNAEELARLDTIAQELAQSRHAVLLYAIRDFIRRYDQGEQPRTKTETKIILDAS